MAVENTIHPFNKSKVKLTVSFEREEAGWEVDKNCEDISMLLFLKTKN